MKRGFSKWKQNRVLSKYALWTASRRGSSVHDKRSRQFSRFAGHLHFGTNSNGARSGASRSSPPTLQVLAGMSCVCRIWSRPQTGSRSKRESWERPISSGRMSRTWMGSSWNRRCRKSVYRCGTPIQSRTGRPALPRRILASSSPTKRLLTPVR
ncbi:hypothetical protein D3C74_202090 [compost metagenome]